MSKNIQEILDYYTNLLIIQYGNKTKAKATSELYINELLANGVFFDIQNGFDIDTAIGKQLDILGKYIGLDRFYSREEVIANTYFQYITNEQMLDGTEVGFTDNANYETDVGQMLDAESYQQFETLDDDDYRFLLKLRIIQNHINHSHKSIDENLFNFFTNDLFASSAGNMQMFYFIKDNINRSLILAAFNKLVLPKPMGVSINGLIQFNENEPYFSLLPVGQSTNSPYATGFTTYDDFDVDAGNFLNYDNFIE